MIHEYEHIAMKIVLPEDCDDQHLFVWKFPRILEEAPGGLWDSFPPIFVPTRPHGAEFWQKNILKESFADYFSSRFLQSILHSLFGDSSSP